MKESQTVWNTYNLKQFASFNYGGAFKHFVFQNLDFIELIPTKVFQTKVVHAQIIPR